MRALEINRKSLEKVITGGIIGSILALFFIDYLVDLSLQVRVMSIVLSLALMAVLILRYKQLLIFGLALIVPLTIQIPIVGKSMISVPAEMICVMLAGFFIVKLLLGYRPDKEFLKHPITILVILDLGWLLITSATSGMPEVSLKRFIIRLSYYITFYYFFFELFKRDKNNIKKTYLLYVLGFIIPILYTLTRHSWINFGTLGSQHLGIPFYYDHTIYGASLVFFIPFLFSGIYLSGTRSGKLLYVTLFFTFITASFLSYSRAAWLSLIISLIIYFIIKYKVRFKFLFAVSGFLLLLLAVNFSKISESLIENKETSHTANVKMHLKSVSNVSTDASNKERINRWNSALRMFMEKPVFGFGPGTYQFFYGSYQVRKDLTRISTFTGNKGHAHSEYLNYLSESGLPGLLIFIALVLLVCYKGIKLAKDNREPEIGSIALFIISA